MHVTIYAIKESKKKANEKISTDVLNELCNRYDKIEYIDIMEPTMAEREVQRLLEHMQANGCDINFGDKSFAINEENRQQLCDGEQYLFLYEGEVWSTKQFIESWDDESVGKTWYVGECLNAHI